LGNTLFDQQLLVFAPFLLGEIAVDGLVHVAWKSPSVLCKIRKQKNRLALRNWKGRMTYPLHPRISS
jgi:hypothetical protein